MSAQLQRLPFGEWIKLSNRYVGQVPFDEFVILWDGSLPESEDAVYGLPAGRLFASPQILKQYQQMGYTHFMRLLRPDGSRWTR